MPARKDEDGENIDENNRTPADLLTAVELLRKDDNHSGDSGKNSSESRNSQITRQKKHIQIKNIQTVQVLFHRKDEDDAGAAIEMKQSADNSCENHGVPPDIIPLAEDLTALKKNTLADNEEDPNLLANEYDDNSRDTVILPQNPNEKYIEDDKSIPREIFHRSDLENPAGNCKIDGAPLKDTTHHQGEGATTETATVSPRAQNLETKKKPKLSKRKKKPLFSAPKKHHDDIETWYCHVSTKCKRDKMVTCSVCDEFCHEKCSKQINRSTNICDICDEQVQK